jgi:hypothetical protein
MLKLTEAIIPGRAPKTPKKQKKVIDTKVSQSLSDVWSRLQDDNIGRLLVVGDAAFREEVAKMVSTQRVSWASCAVEDVLAGLPVPDAALLTDVDGVLCGGKNVEAVYRLVLTLLAPDRSAMPVYWVGEGWEFCGGTLAVPAGTKAEALLFNHFRQYFGIKDPIHFTIETIRGASIERRYRTLGPDQSEVIRFADDMASSAETQAIRAFATHPVLTRGRHYRLRVCADVFWAGSLTTLHSAHEFNRPPDRLFEFRLPNSVVAAADITLTVPNFALDMVAGDEVVSFIDGHKAQSVKRPPTALVSEYSMTAKERESAANFGWQYHGYGGSNWFARHKANGSDRGQLAANHHASAPIADLNLAPPSAQESQLLAGLKERGFLVEPHAVPILPSETGLRLGFDFDGANPQFADFLVYMFDRAGAYLGVAPFHHAKPGRVFADEIECLRQQPRAALALITPDWQKVGFSRKGSKLQGNLIIEDRKTGDWDVTEFQDCWRNVGAVVPGMAHFAGPMGPVNGRTNLFARARQGGGARTALLAVHGSGRLDYARGATLDVAVLNADGERRSFPLDMPAFTWQLVWLDQFIPDLAAFLGPQAVGPLLVTSTTGDVNCQIVTVQDGAVSLQHMWGY